MMPRPAQHLFLLALLCTLGVPGPLSEESRSETQLRIEIAAISDMSYSKPYGCRDKHFWNIVRQGPEVVPDLLRLIEDDSSTGVRVHLFGGEYAVGDIAVLVLWKIYPDLPVVKFVDDPKDSKFESVGFGVYWRYVRESPSNRKQLRGAITEWIATHRSQLLWVSRDNHPAGGWYALRGSSSR